MSNSNLKDVAVVIPVYKGTLTMNESISLKQCFKILGSHDIIFVMPRELNFSCYENLIKGNKSEKRYFDKIYFQNIHGYNKLLCSANFYKRFSDYKHILIYQLDVFVFRDELSQWLNKSYHYIGAPWFEGWSNTNPENRIIGVGNGGFSLRSVEASLRVLNRFNRIKALRSIWLKSKIHHIYSFRQFLLNFRKLLKINSVNNIDQDFSGFKGHEDYFWALLMPSCFSDFTIAPVEEAIRFSFEVNPAYLFKINNEKLPFGCHGWGRHEPEFWKKFIPL